MYAKDYAQVFRMWRSVDMSMIYILSPSWYCQYAIPDYWRDKAYITHNTYYVWNMQLVHILVKEWRWNHYWECAVEVPGISEAQRKWLNIFRLVATNIKI